MSPPVARAIETVLFPPLFQILLVVLGLLLMGRFRRLGRFFAWLGVITLYLAAMPVTGGLLDYGLRSIHPPLLPQQARETDARAIVILSAGFRDYAAEFGSSVTVDDLGLERLRYGVYLHHLTGLPILVAGGDPFGMRDTTLSREMARALKESFGVEARWLEERSRTTWENAVYTSELLVREGITKVLLVTHGRHMPRSVWSFQRLGMDVVAAPTHGGDPGKGLYYLKKFLPTAKGLEETVATLHEWAGWGWYWLKMKPPTP